MGTVLEITLVAEDPERARAAIARCFAEIDRLETIFTTWREDGELAQLNARSGRGPQRASPELIAILRDARAFSQQTGGAFDVTVGPLVALWRRAGARGALPSEREIAEARSRVGGAQLRLDPSGGTIELAAGASLDLGGIAKGWALDRVGERLRDEGFARGLLDFGGSSLLALGAPADGPAWRVLVEAGLLLRLRDVSVSISDGFSQFAEIGDRRVSHIIDPRSGLPVPHAQRAIVVAPLGGTAEAWSTALVVLPAREGVARARARGDLEVRIDAAGAEPRATPSFSRYVEAKTSDGTR
jgi:thiamine biosynthesis lipoprotein